MTAAAGDDGHGGGRDGAQPLRTPAEGHAGHAPQAPGGHAAAQPPGAQAGPPLPAAPPPPPGPPPAGRPSSPPAPPGPPSPPGAGWPPVPPVPPGPPAPPPPPPGMPVPGAWYPAYGLPAPKPGVIPLRPLGLGDLLGALFSTVGRYWRQTYGVTALLLALYAVAACAAAGLALAALWQVDGLGTALDGFGDALDHDLYDTPYAPYPDLTGDQVTALVLAVLAVAAVLGLLGLYLFGALHAAYAVVVSYAALGRPLTPGALWRAARPRVPAAAGTQLIAGLVVGGFALLGYGMLIAFLVAAVAGALGPDGGPRPVGLGLVGGLLLLPTAGACACFFYVRFLVAPSAAVLEGRGAGAAVGRSWRLVRGSWWRVFGISLLIMLIVSVAAQILDTLLYTLTVVAASGIASASGGDPGISFTLALVAFSFVLLLLGSVATLPFPYLANTLLYLDLRIRRESFDLVLAAEAGLPAHRPV